MEREAIRHCQKELILLERFFFDPKDLETILSRSDRPFLRPTLPYEISGQYSAGTTFAEGLVYYKEKWFLYYGTADSYVGVAVSK